MNVFAVEKFLYGVICFFAFSTNLSTGATSVALVFGMLLLLYKGFRFHKWPKIEHSWAFIFIIYAIAQCIIAAFSTEQANSFGEVQAMLVRLLIVFLPLSVADSKERLHGLLIAFVLSITIANIYGIYQFFAFPTGVRPRAFTNSTTVYGGQLILAIGVLLMTWFETTSAKIKVCIALNFLATIFLLIVSGCRGALVGVILTLFVLPFVVTKHRKKMIAVMLLGFTVLAAAIFVWNPYNIKERMVSLSAPTQASSSMQRIYMWDASLRIWSDYPLLGVGQGNFTTFYKLEKYRDKKALYFGNPHNNIMQVLAEGGTLGTAAFFLLYGFILFWLLREYRQDGNDLALCGFLMTLAFHLDGLTECNAMNTPNAREFWLIMGIILSSKLLKKKSRLK